MYIYYVYIHLYECVPVYIPQSPSRPSSHTHILYLQQPLELLLPCGPHLSKQSEACVATYARQQQGGAGSQHHQRVVRVERRPAAQFDLGTAKEVRGIVWFCCDCGDRLFVLHSHKHRTQTIAAHQAKLSSSSSLPQPLQSLPPDCLRVLGPLLEHAAAFGIERLLLARPSVKAFAGEAGRHFTLDGVTLRDLEVRFDSIQPLCKCTR